jgi:cytochrome c556
MRGGESLTFSATGKEEDVMDSEKILTSCKSVLQAFDGLTDEGEFDSSRNPGKMRDEFWDDLSGFDEMTKGMEDKTFNKWVDIMQNHAALAFTIGYALGQMFDLFDKEILDDLDTVKQAIRDKALLPYLPRERKAA